MRLAPAGASVPATILEFLPTIGPAEGWAHGERLHYSTPNTDLLGLVAERAAGAPLAELIARELWAPLGAERDALLTVDTAGTAAIGGGFCATLRDYARLGELVRRDGAGVVPAEWIARLGVGEDGAFARSSWATEGATGYGLQWWRFGGRQAARGIHGQFVAVDRAAGVVVAILSSWPEATPSASGLAQLALLDAVCDALRHPAHPTCWSPMWPLRSRS